MSGHEHPEVACNKIWSENEWDLQLIGHIKPCITRGLLQTCEHYNSEKFYICLPSETIISYALQTTNSLFHDELQQRSVDLVFGKDSDGWTALHRVALLGDKMAVEQILQYIHKDYLFSLISLQDFSGKTSVHRAAKSPVSYEILRTILSHLQAKQVQEILMMPDFSGFTPFYHAASDNREDNRSVHLMLSYMSSEDVLTLLSQFPSNKHLDRYFSRQVSSNILSAIQSCNPEQMSLLASWINHYCPHAEVIELLNEREMCNVLVEVLKLNKSLRSIFLSADLSSSTLLRRRTDGETLMHSISKAGDLDLFLDAFARFDCEDQKLLLATLNTANLSVEQVANGRVKEFCSWYNQTTENYYPLSNSPYVIIIYTTKLRKNAEIEKENIEDCLKLWSSVSSKVLKDPHKEEIKKTLNDVNERVKPSAVLVVIMTHGQAGCFEVESDSISIQDFITNYLWSKSSPEIPRALVLQACQQQQMIKQSESHQSVDAKATAGRTVSDSAAAVSHQLKLERHMAVIMAAQHGQVAERSLFIPLLAKHLRLQGGDIYEAFMKVAKEMSCEKPEQVPVFQSTLVNKLCLAQIFKPSDLAEPLCI